MTTQQDDSLASAAGQAALAVQQQAQQILAHASFGTAAHTQFVRSPANARKKPRDLAKLLALVRTQGVLQNLVCYPQVVDGVPTGRHMVAAGDGRWQVVGLLIAEGSLPEDYQIPYLLVSEAEALLVSLAENLGREELHPADIVAAMQALVAQGRGIAEIALTFSLSELTVRRYLKLANVAPRLFALYRADKIHYEQMAALAVSDDHAAQQAAWDALQDWERQPHRLRRLLTQHSAAADSDRVARYVGLKAYTAAGGMVTRDLFSASQQGYIDDTTLLDALAHAKLGRVARRLKREAWAWIVVQPRTDPAALAQYARVRSASCAPTPEQAAQLQALAQQAAELAAAADHAGDGAAESALVQALTDNSLAQGRIRAALTRPDPADRALAGALVTIDEDGKACVLRGLIRPQDKGRMARQDARQAQQPAQARPAHSARKPARRTARA